MPDATPSRFLNYRGDTTDHPLGQIVGPDMFHGMWRSVTAHYDAETDRTRVGFLPHFVAKDPA